MRERAPVQTKREWYLTISLGERYDRKNRAYKLAAAGVEIK